MASKGEGNTRLGREVPGTENRMADSPEATEVATETEKPVEAVAEVASVRKVAIELAPTYSVQVKGVHKHVCDTAEWRPEAILAMALHGLGQRLGDAFAGVVYRPSDSEHQAKIAKVLSRMVEAEISSEFVAEIAAMFPDLGGKRKLLARAREVMALSADHPVRVEVDESMARRAAARKRVAEAAAGLFSGDGSADD